MSIERIRLLLVDDDQKLVEDQQRYLSDFYEIYIAQGIGDDLIEDAKRKARQYRCHIALVDIQLYGGRSSDRAGLRLVADLQPTRCIILTGTPGYDPLTVKSIFTETVAETVVWKAQGPDAYKAEIEKVSQKYFGNLQPVIEWPNGLLLNNTFSSTLENTLEEFEANEIIFQLFPNASTIKLDRLSGSVDSDTLDTTSKRSIVLLAYEDTKQPVVVKLMKAGRAEVEKRNYDLVSRYLGGNRRSQLLKVVEWWNLSGVSYELIGESTSTDSLYGIPLRTFSKVYRDETNSTKIVRILRRYFLEVWGRLLDPSLPLKDECEQELSNSQFIKKYLQVWEEDLGDAESIAKKWSKESPEFSFSILHDGKSLVVKAFNPIQWVATRQFVVPRARQTIVHGDLHGKNLLVDNQYNAWSIDFGRTRCAHNLTDFGQLTQYILTNLAVLPENDHTLMYHLAIALCKPRTSRAKIIWTNAIQSSPEATKALKVIDALWKVAQTTTHTTDIREYLLSVLMDAIAVSQILPRGYRQDRLLILGAVICQRLSNWGEKTWPPKSWPKVTWVSKEKVSMIKILFLAANPSDTTRLQIGQEFREVKEAIQKVGQRERFALTVELAVRVSELIQLLVQQKPTIVHFSGHGSEEGEIILEDEIGNRFPLPQEAVKRIFGILNRDGNQIRCVILNACFTEQQARYLSEYVDIVIGISSEIGDTSAIKFAGAFYTVAGEGESVQMAFDLACENIDLHRLDFKDALRLITKPGIDPNHYRLV